LDKSHHDAPAAAGSVIFSIIASFIDFDGLDGIKITRPSL
jgi:hypothetical protein